MMSFTGARTERYSTCIAFIPLTQAYQKPLNNVLEKGQTHIGSEKQKNQKACIYYANTQVLYKKSQLDIS